MRYLVWDFDGTLGHRAGRWSSALLDVLRRTSPDRDPDEDALAAQLRRGFPWHAPELPHPELASSETWWRALSPTFVRAFEAGGMDPATSRKLAAEVRETYVDPRHWRLFADAAPALGDLSSRGWTHLILSNHVPELPEILTAVGIADRIHQVFNSAESGYEKPHPRAFTGVLETAAGSEAWMVGDNPAADVGDAESVGLPAILVRGDRRGARHHCEDLSGVAAIVGPWQP